MLPFQDSCNIANVLAIPKQEVYYNPYFILQNWLRSDLSVGPIKDLSIEIIKEKLAILKSLVPNNHGLKKQLSHILASDSMSLCQRLQDMYITLFFSEKIYHNFIISLHENRDKHELSRKLKMLNYPQKLSFVIVMKNDQRKLNQMERASVITKAAIDLYMRFKKNQFSTRLNPKGSLSTYSYQYFFTATVIPYFDKPFDHLHVHNESKHIIVMIGGQAYSLTVIEDARPITAENILCELYAIIKHHQADNNIYPALGPISSSSRTKRCEIKQKLYQSNSSEIQELENSIFTLCLDEEPYGENIGEDIFTHHSLNRYFGNTQIIIGKNSEAAIIANFVTIEGAPAIEIADTLYEDSINISLTNNTYTMTAAKKLNFNFSVSEFAVLLEDTLQIHHPHKASFTLKFGLDFFKAIGLSPNITMNFLLMLAAKDMVDYFPVINHATSRREYGNSHAQLDWNYISPKKLSEFYHNRTNYKLLKDAVEEHQQKIMLTKQGMSPSFFVQKPDGAVFDQLCDFYLYLGSYFPAYRNYLFNTYRNNQSIDIMTSSLKLPPSIRTLGRHGSCSEVLSMFGLHILMNRNETELVFIPNKAWISIMDNYVEKIIHWGEIISNLCLVDGSI